MKLLQFLTLAFVASLVAINCAYSSSIGNVQEAASQQAVSVGAPASIQQGIQQGGQPLHDHNAVAPPKDGDKVSGVKPSGRFLGLVSGYEQQPLPYAPQPLYEQPYAPVQQSYGSSYQTPSYTPASTYTPPVSSYSAPAYTPPVSSYSAPAYTPPVSSYSAPAYTPPVSSYSAPAYTPPVSSYSAPLTTSYEQPIAQTYQAPVASYSNYSTSSYSAAPVLPSTYGASSYAAAPVLPSTYGASSYAAAPALPSTYGASSYAAAPVLPSTYGASSYAAPVTNYSTSSYQAPIVPSYGSNYSAPIIPPYQPVSNYSASSYSAPSYTPPVVSSYSAPVTSSYSAPSYTPPVVSSYSAPSSYIPPVAPAYPAPSTYETPIVQNYTAQPYVAPVVESYPSLPSYSQQSYAPATSSYAAPSYIPPVPSSYAQPLVPPVQSYAPQQSYAQPQYQAGYAKRTLTGHEAAPYQLLVDHLAAAASDVKEIFANVSAIECPTKPSDYTCPQMMSKDELKKKICEYDTVLTGSASFVPDTDKAQTRCGAMKVLNQDSKSDDESSTLVSADNNKLAIILGKECESKQIAELSPEEQVFLLVKSTIPPSTRFIVMDGASMDIITSQQISKEEISSLMNTCSRVGAQ